jgi:hypothetical protein
MVAELNEKDLGVTLYICRPVHELNDRIRKGSIDIFKAIGDPMDEKLDNLWLIYQCAEEALAKLN